MGALSENRAISSAALDAGLGAPVVDVAGAGAAAASGAAAGWSPTSSPTSIKPLFDAAGALAGAALDFFALVLGVGAGAVAPGSSAASCASSGAAARSTSAAAISWSLISAMPFPAARERAHVLPDAPAGAENFVQLAARNQFSSPESPLVRRPCQPRENHRPEASARRALRPAPRAAGAVHASVQGSPACLRPDGPGRARVARQPPPLT